MTISSHRAFQSPRESSVFARSLHYVVFTLVRCSTTQTRLSPSVSQTSVYSPSVLLMSAMDSLGVYSPNLDLVIPPPNFAMVSPGVYRSGYPNVVNHSFLKSLQLKTLIYLCPESCDDSNVNFCKQNGIQILQFGIQGNKEPFVDMPEPVCPTNLLKPPSASNFAAKILH